MHTKKILALFLCLLMCVQALSGSVFATETTGYTATGNGVKVTFNPANGTLTLYRLYGQEAIQMSNASSAGHPIVNGQPVNDFANYTCTVSEITDGKLGAGDRMVITSTSTSTGLVRTYTLETSDVEAGVIYTETSYRATTAAVTPTWFVDSYFELSNHTNVIWSYNGGGEGPMHYYDTLQKIDLTDSTTFSRENKQDSTAASIPVADIYSANGGITVGDASATRREVHTPVQETAQTASVSIKWPGKALAVNTDTAVGQSFIIVHSGDYYCGLRGYKNAMECLDVIMPTLSADSQSYDLRWESWGWGSNWTIDLILGKLDDLQAAGVKQITLDDGWYTNAGDWTLSPSKFPNGVTDALRLTNAIHAHGMTAVLWWRPCDGGINSTLAQQHPEYFVKNSDGSLARLPIPGGSGTNPSLGYALCPCSSGAIASQIDFIDRAMNDWGFDGFKADYVWSLPKCYNTAHNHAYPEESTEKQAEFYKTGYEAMKENDPDVFNLLCNCGTPQDYYSLPYMTQVATADPTSKDQTRRRVKAYKALLGDYYPVTTDHNEIWYATTVGTGSVLIEKRAMLGADWNEYVRWLNIANTEQLHKGQFVGDLYSYGFDPYETYVVQKGGVMYYAFYRDGNKFTTTGYPEIELKGLDSSKMYRIVDYVNDRIVATNLTGDNMSFTNHFSDYLLVKAIEISEPDPDVIDTDFGFTSIDDRDEGLVYTGSWTNDSNTAFYEGTARYTSSENASVEFSFYGTAIRWYGQKDTNFGTADVFIDEQQMTTVNANGSLATGQLLYETLNLEPGTHTIKIVRKTGVIDIDRFTYQPATPEVSYTNVNALSNQITYSGTWTTTYNDAFYEETAKYSDDPTAYAEFSFYGTAIRWYGQYATTLGRADVYLDGELVSAVIQYADPAIGQLLYEQTGLTEGQHTIRIAYGKGPMDIDYFAYANENATSTPESTVVVVDAIDERLIYSETWVSDSNAAFQAGTAKYTNSAGASVSLTFTGTAVQWYGQNDTNFGTATVYIDNEVVTQANVNGTMTAQKLIFEQTDLPYGSHTIQIVCNTPVIDLDYLSYTGAE